MARIETLVDTGPLVVYLDRRDEHYEWAVEATNRLDIPFYTCEAVLSEAFHMLERVPGGGQRLLKLLDRNILDTAFSYTDHRERVHELMRVYADRPMSFADACMVRLSEIHQHSRVFTTDDDFQVYRRHGDEAIDVLMP